MPRQLVNLPQVNLQSDLFESDGTFTLNDSIDPMGAHFRHAELCRQIVDANIELSGLNAAEHERILKYSAGMKPYPFESVF